MSGLPRVIVSNNETQFLSAMVTDLYNDLGVQTNFVSVVHQRANGQEKSTNEVTLKGLKKSLDDTKGLWEELLHEILWLYHTIMHTTTRENPFAMVYGADAMFPVEIYMPSW